MFAHIHWHFSKGMAGVYVNTSRTTSGLHWHHQPLCSQPVCGSSRCKRQDYRTNISKGGYRASLLPEDSPATCPGYIRQNVSAWEPDPFDYQLQTKSEIFFISLLPLGNVSHLIDNLIYLLLNVFELESERSQLKKEACCYCGFFSQGGVCFSCVNK